MKDTVYILVREDNQFFLGAYATHEDAAEAAKAHRAPTEILHWVIVQKPLPTLER